MSGPAPLIFLALPLWLGGCATVLHEQALVTEEFMVPSADPGIELYVRNKRATSESQFSGERIVLFVHGSTYPAETAFDLPLNGVSWMEYIARQGYDVYLVDLRGYGRSTRPPEMDQPAERNAPLTTTSTAVRDVGSAVEFIRKRRGVERINLLGWSWGTTIMATYTTRNTDRVNKLLLYAPQWIRTTPSLIATSGPLGAYRLVQEDAAKARWLTGVPETKKAELIPAGWFEAWAAATFSSDPWRRSACRPCFWSANGTRTRRPTWRRPCFRSSSTRPTSSWCRSARRRIPCSWKRTACSCSARCRRFSISRRRGPRRRHAGYDHLSLEITNSTRVPSPGVEWMCSSAPTERARSSMIISPPPEISSRRRRCVASIPRPWSAMLVTTASPRASRLTSTLRAAAWFATLFSASM
jgi:pimeloyl-ACP methyl ester carboxylesterase